MNENYKKEQTPTELKERIVYLEKMVQTMIVSSQHWQTEYQNALKMYGKLVDKYKIRDKLLTKALLKLSEEERKLILSEWEEINLAEQNKPSKNNE